MGRGKDILYGIMGGLAVLANTKKATETAIDSVAGRLSRWRKKGDLKEEYVGRYVLAYPNSSPANVIWGVIKQVQTREAGEYDLVIEHMVHRYKQYVRNDNIYSMQFFESKEKLLEYVNWQIKEGNLREGSLRITGKGAKEYGTLILNSLKEDIIKDSEIRNEIPENFVPVIVEAQKQFNQIDKEDVVFFNSNMSELSSKFPLESIVVLTVINNVFMMRNLAIVSE